jgi:release factor glutamine methyltransferase
VPPASLSALADRAASAIAGAGVPADESIRDAASLARWILGWDAARWLAHRHERAPADFATRFEAVVARRIRREPMAYITGVREFYGREFAVTPDVLVPRPETELLTDVAVSRIAGLVPSSPHSPPVVVDVGTGSGCVAITLALESPGMRVTATDSSAAALDIARDNAARLSPGAVEFRQGDLLAGLEGPIDVVVSNPPYVALDEREALPPEVAGYEPAAALFGGPDGLDVIRALVPAAAPVLRPGGWLIFEIGHGQDRDVRTIVAGEASLELVEIRPDLRGIPRCVVARRRIA